MQNRQLDNPRSRDRSPEGENQTREGMDNLGLAGEDTGVSKGEVNAGKNRLERVQSYLAFFYKLGGVPVASISPRFAAKSRSVRRASCALRLSKVFANFSSKICLRHSRASSSASGVQ